MPRVRNTGTPPHQYKDLVGVPQLRCEYPGLTRDCIYDITHRLPRTLLGGRIYVSAKAFREYLDERTVAPG